MLRSLKDLEHYGVSATDGDIGKVVNFLLDDERWAVRYLVVETGGWLDGRRVLVSPISFGKAEWATKRFQVALTQDQIRNSPSVDTDKPVSRQHEQDYFGYYGYPYYWGYTGLWGMGTYPLGLTSGRPPGPPAEALDASLGDSHLRSIDEMLSYKVQGSDASVGKLCDFIVDDESWEVRYLVVDTSPWWTGKKVLVAPRWTSRISWEDGVIEFEKTREWIKACPEWDPDAPVNREYEARLYDYHGRPVYWDDSDRPVGASPPSAGSSHAQ